MSRPIPEADSLPSWKLRLLERIQNLAAERTQVLRQGYPIYQPHYGSTEIPVQTWRTHLRALEAECQEVTVHAVAVGVADTAIQSVWTAGAQGSRWGDSVHSPRTMRHGEDPIRAGMVEDLADDIWRLEHMAAIAAERKFRGQEPHHVGDDPVLDQFDRNLAAVWTRATHTARVLGLTDAERADLWGRDEAGWQQLVEVTVMGYDDAELEERWRTYGWRGVEHQARQDIDRLAAGRIPQMPGTEPPHPRLLVEHATTAVETFGSHDPAPDLDTGEAAEEAPAAGAIWDATSDSATGADPRWPEAGPSTEQGL